MYDSAILLGILVSLFFTELTGLPAGLVVPGYLVLCLHAPWRIVYTLLIAFVATLLCKLLSYVFILYGRRRFAMLLILTIALNFLVRSVEISPYNLNIIGFVVPGIIAREFDRQGFLKTFVSLAITCAFLAAILMLFGYPVFGG